MEPNNHWILNRVNLTDKVASHLGVLCFIYGVIFYYLGVRNQFAVLPFLLGLSYFFCRYLNQKGFYNLSRLWMVVPGATVVSVYSYLLGPATLTHYILISLSSYAFVLYTIKEWRYLVTTAFYPVILFFVVFYVPDPFKLQVDLPAEHVKVLRWACIIGSLSLLLISNAYLFISNEYQLRMKESFYARYIETTKQLGMSDMAGGMAHEINNPLSIIMLQAEKLSQLLKLNKLTSEEIEKRMKPLLEASYRIRRIINYMKMLSNEGANLPYTSICLSKLLEVAIKNCEDKKTIPAVDVKLEIQDDAFIAGSSSQLINSFSAVINNALEAANRSDRKWVKVLVHGEGQQIIIDVVNSGRSVSSEVEEKLFLPFFTTKEVGKGVGLNLSVARIVVESHHGKLYYLKGEENTTFRFELPLVSLAM